MSRAEYFFRAGARGNGSVHSDVGCGLGMRGIHGQVARPVIPTGRRSYSGRHARHLARLAVQAREPINGGVPCIYCGALATTVDHVPPKRARKQLLAMGLEMTFEFAEFPACRECNCVLSDRDLWTIAERKAYIRRRLIARYRHELRIPDWGDSELAELEPGLRGYVLDGLVVRDFVRARLRWSMFTKSKPRSG